MKRTQIYFLISLVALGLPYTSDADDARSTMKKGIRLYHEAMEMATHEDSIDANAAQEEKMESVSQALTGAAAAFREAAEQAEAEELDPAPAYFNLGDTLYRGGKFEEAGTAYTKALRSPDLQIQSKSFYNRGNVLRVMAAADEQQQNLQESLAKVTQALDMYENSLRLNAGDTGAKINLELALRKKKELEEKIEQQKQQQQQKQDQQDQEQDKQKEQQQEQNQNEQQQQNQQKDQQKQQQQEQQQQEQTQQQPENTQDQTDENPQSEQQQGGQAEPSSEEMTQEEAEMLLDAMRSDEKAQRDRMRLIMGKREPVEKDW